MPSAAARARASDEGSNLFQIATELSEYYAVVYTHTDSWRNLLTLCIVMRDVGLDEMMMIGKLLPRRSDV